jgi:hypothetical protein
VFGDAAEGLANPTARLGREIEQELQKHRNSMGLISPSWALFIL